MNLLRRLFRPRCKEGDGMLVYWCVTHGASWYYDDFPWRSRCGSLVCEKRFLELDYQRPDEPER